MNNYFKKSIVTSLLLIGLTSVSVAKELGSIADSRFSTTWTLDGASLANARATLLNTTNFGPGGTVNEAINITDTAAPITTALLSTFDSFFIGYLDDADVNAFTPTELTAMSNYVNGGGTMIVTCDDPAYDAVCTHFGYPVTSGVTSPTLPTAAGIAHPIFTAPFGTVTTVPMAGALATFTTTAGAVILGTDSSIGAGPTVLERSLGAGKIILISDVNMIDANVDAGINIDNDNERFLANLFSYALNNNLTSPNAVPSLSFYGLILLTGLLGLFGMRKTRRIK